MTITQYYNKVEVSPKHNKKHRPIIALSNEILSSPKREAKSIKHERESTNILIHNMLLNTLLKKKRNENSSTRVKYNSFPLIKRAFSS